MKDKQYTSKEIEQYYTKCEFDDECNLCDNPENGSYASGYVNDENGCEVDYYICGKCANKEMPKLIKEREEDALSYKDLNIDL